jgi:hypothetical protein
MYVSERASMYWYPVGCVCVYNNVFVIMMMKMYVCVVVVWWVGGGEGVDDDGEIERDTYIYE